MHLEEISVDDGDIVVEHYSTRSAIEFLAIFEGRLEKLWKTRVIVKILG